MIGIIGAMEEEVAELKKDMQIEETVETGRDGILQGNTRRQRCCNCKKRNR